MSAIWWQCSRPDLAEFHDDDYLDVLQREEISDSLVAPRAAACGMYMVKFSRPLRSRQIECLCNQNASPGLCDDCAIFPGVFDYCRWVAGATLTAVDLLLVRPVLSTCLLTRCDWF
jgi:acetoin utilization deacetylase AcuC-like enzyme